MERIIVGTRGSALALWQARWVMRRLRRLFPQAMVHEKIIKTQGDLDQTSPLGSLGGKGVFTTALDDALLDGQIDLAVHSMKDYPTTIPEGLALVAAPDRVAPCDALITADGRPLADLAPGSRIGAGSLRRISQLGAYRPDLTFADLRGNLDTRLRRLDEGRFDAILLAAAGLRRLGWGGRIAQTLPYHIMLPAVGQGALAVTGRADERRRWARLDDPAVSVATGAERALLAALGGGCHVPVGALARLRGRRRLYMQAVVADPEAGGRVIRVSLDGPAERPEALGRRAAHILIDRGAGEILGLQEGVS